MCQHLDLKQQSFPINGTCVPLCLVLRKTESYPNHRMKKARIERGRKSFMRKCKAVITSDAYPKHGIREAREAVQ